MPSHLRDSGLNTKSGTGPTPADSSRAHPRPTRWIELGYSLIELVLVMAILAILASMAIESGFDVFRRTKLQKAVLDIRAIDAAIALHLVDNGLPASLSELPLMIPPDPWGTPYQYGRLTDLPKGKWRKDRFLVPLNSDYDLYSKGPDRDSRPPLTAKASRDDVVRAGDGVYVGRAEDY